MCWHAYKQILLKTTGGEDDCFLGGAYDDKSNYKVEHLNTFWPEGAGI